MTEPHRVDAVREMRQESHNDSPFSDTSENLVFIPTTSIAFINLTCTDNKTAESELALLKKDFERVQAELLEERKARLAVELKLAVFQNGLDMMISRLAEAEAETSLSGSPIITNPNPTTDLNTDLNTSQADQNVVVEATDIQADREHSENDVESHSEVQFATGASAFDFDTVECETQQLNLEDEILGLQARPRDAEDHAVTTASRLLQATNDLEKERAKNTPQQNNLEAAQAMVAQLCRFITYIPLSAEDYAPFYRAVVSSKPMAAARRERNIENADIPYSINAPGLETDESLPKNDPTFWQPSTSFVLLTTFAVIKTDQVKTFRGVQTVSALLKYLQDGIPLQADVLSLVLQGILDGLDNIVDQDVDGLCEKTIRMILWRISREIEYWWPSFDVSRIKRVVECDPFIYDVTRAMESKTLAEFARGHGVVKEDSHFQVTMIKVYETKRVLFVYDWFSYTAFFTTRWKSSKKPRCISAWSHGTQPKAKVNLFVDNGNPAHKQLWHEGLEFQRKKQQAQAPNGVED